MNFKIRISKSETFGFQALQSFEFRISCFEFSRKLPIVSVSTVCYTETSKENNLEGSDMPDIPRLNGVIKALEQGQTTFVAFTPVDIESAIAMAGSKLDGVAFEMEHAPLDFPGLRGALQFMLDRRDIVERATLAPTVTPMVRIPPNGIEMNSWIAKQVLD